MAASAVRGFPLHVLSGATEHAVFAPWRGEASRIACAPLLTSAAMLVLIALAAWGLAQRERALERERKLADAERGRLEQRLRQGEKMEAVGRLAGGIAHDFNNILGGILGYAEMLFEQTAEGSPLKRYARNVLTAANRARGLVDQILAYSRSQRGKRVAGRFRPHRRGNAGADPRLPQTGDAPRGQAAGDARVRSRRRHATAPDPDEPVHERHPGDG